MKSLNKYFDHTVLKPETTEEQVKELCQEAKEHDFYAVCVNSCYVEDAAKYLEGTGVKVAAVIGFPLGQATTESKAFETKDACEKGALEIDMVLNVGKFKSNNIDFCINDIAEVVKVANNYNAKVKVILETCLLSDDEIVKACEISKEAGAHFVKTSTGFNSQGATEDHIKLMKETVGDALEVKASGGIRTYEKVKKMIEAGADRIGASASVNIMKESKKS